MSPGGRMRYSRRTRPELPPSSVTVTTAARSAIGRRPTSCRRRATCSFNPPSSAERPCRRPPKRCGRVARDDWRRLSNPKRSIVLPAGTLAFRVEQLGEAGVLLQEREVLVVAGVVAVFRPQVNGRLQVFHRRFGLAGQAVERGHGIEDVIGLGSQLAGPQ